jgi:hypothetical protein
VSRCVPGLSCWIAPAALLCHLFAPLSAFAATPIPIAITFAEQAVHLVRDTGMYSAGRGTALRADDVIDSGNATIQLDFAGSTVAVGPDSQVFIRHGMELVLLKGWLKVRGAVPHGVRLSTAGVQFDSTGATVTLHVVPGTSELFPESSDLAVTELADGKAQRGAKVPREQFGVKNGTMPLKLATRPPRDFLAGMPRAFLDVLIPVAVKGPTIPPRRERRITFAELAPWLAEQPSLRQQVQRRFSPFTPAPR